MSPPQNIQPFLSTELTYRSSQETGAISDVKRLAPSGGMPLRFSKVIRGSYARLITYENNLLQEVDNSLPHARVVKRKSDTNLSNANGELAREIVTEDAGVDISKWYALPVSIEVNGTTQSYPSAFCHPVMLLNVTLHILKVFKGIHEAGIVHCDIKEDQICIPAKVVKTGDSYDITPDFDGITLIDFGNALWERVHIFKEYNPLPFNTAKALPYQAQKLIEASERQQDYFKKHREYSFTQALNDVDYSVDLYSLGYMLQQMLEHHVKPNLNFSDPITLIWSKFINEYERLVDELLQYNVGLIHNYSNSYLPHDEYLDRINHWLSLVGIPSNITFNTSTSASVTHPTIDPTPVVPTPLLGEDTTVNKNSKLNNKEVCPIPIWLLAIALVIQYGFSYYKFLQNVVNDLSVSYLHFFIGSIFWLIFKLIIVSSDSDSNNLNDESRYIEFDIYFFLAVLLPALIFAYMCLPYFYIRIKLILF